MTDLSLAREQLLAELIIRGNALARAAGAAARNRRVRGSGVGDNANFGLLVGRYLSKRRPSSDNVARAFEELVASAPLADEEIGEGVAAWRAALASGASGIGSFPNRARAFLNTCCGGLFGLGLRVLVLLLIPTSDLN